MRQEAERVFQDIEFNPDRQQIIEERLSTLYSLQQKHSVSTVKELMYILEDISIRLKENDSLDHQIEHLEEQFIAQKKIVYAEADKLSAQRKSVIHEIEERVEQQLIYLGIPNARLQINFTERKEPNITGKDVVGFLFSATKNSQLQPIDQIASGGEISRLMLTLKSLVADATALATIIFDEVDTGTSGEIADKMGLIMRELSKKMQVITITHLPQIAAKGNSHYYVFKQELKDFTTTSIKQLSTSERIEELASMLSGAETTVQALENAKVMLKANE